MKIYFTILLCLALLTPTVSSQVFIPEPVDGSTASRWKFSLNGGGEREEVSRDKSTLTILDNSGNIVEEIDRSDISVDSDIDEELLKALSRKNFVKAPGANIGVEYRIWKGLSAYVNAGINKMIPQEQLFLDGEKLSDISDTSGKISFTYSVGLQYQFDFGKNIFVMIRPGFTHTLNSSTYVGLEEYEVEIGGYDYSFKAIRWDVPVIIGYRFGKIAPYIGVKYHDSRFIMQYEYGETYVGEEYTKRMRDTYYSSCKIKGLIGVSLSVTNHLSVGVAGSIGRSYSAEGKISYTL